MATELSTAVDRAVWPEKVQLDKAAATMTTYRMGGLMDELYLPESLTELEALLAKIPKTMPLTLIGWGGNVVVAQAGIRGVTIGTRKLDAVTQLDAKTFTIEAGAHLAKVAKLAADAGLTGGEFLIGIPGTIGGAVRMNAGALGQQTSDVVVSATVWNRQTGQAEVWPAEQLGYAYRHSELNPKHHIVLEATLRFTPTDDVDAVRQRMQASVTFRKTHHPIEPNGGSVFRNPLPTAFNPHPWPVGRMLDALGARGTEVILPWTEGGTSISPRHANFIINTGEGTSTDVLRLMCRMKSAIQQHYGVGVIPENILLGELSPEECARWAWLTSTDVTAMPDFS